MDDKTRSADADRRGFLRLMGAGVVGGTAAVTPIVGAQAAPAKADAAKDGYRETDHVRRYYELAR